MRQLLSTGIAMSLLWSTAAFAVDVYPAASASKVVSYNSTTRLLTVQIGLMEPYSILGCVVDASVGVPASIAAGRAIAFSYTGPGAGQPGAAANNDNKCSNIALQ